MGLFSNLFNSDQKKISECIEGCCEKLRDAGYGEIEIQKFKREQEEYSKKSLEEDKKNKRDKNRTIEYICKRIEDWECQSMINNIERKRKFLKDRIEENTKEYKNESEEVQKLLKELEEIKFNEDNGYPIDFERRIDLYFEILEKAGGKKEKINQFREEAMKGKKTLPRKADEESKKDVLRGIDFSFWGELSVIQKMKEYGLYSDHPIDVDSLIRDCLLKLENEGYGEKEIQEFEKTANRTKNIVAESGIEEFIEKDLKEKIDKIRKDKEELKEELKEKNNNLGPEEQEIVVKRMNLRFNWMHGHKINLKDLISTAIEEMNVLGYGKEKIEEFQKYSEGLIKKIPPQNNSIEVSSTFDLIYNQIDMLTETMMKDRDALGREIEEIKNSYEGKEQELRIKEINLDFQESHGKPIDKKSRVQIYIDRLKDAGYGDKKTVKFQSEFYRAFDENGISKKTVSNIGLEVAGYLGVIKKGKEILNQQIEETRNLENLSDCDKRMVILYSNEDNKEEYIQKLINNSIKMEIIKFDIKNGHDRFKELQGVLIERLKLYGYSDEIIEEAKSQMIRIERMGIKNHKSVEERIERMDSIINPYISRNQRNIVLYTNEGVNELMESISIQMGYQSKDDFIKKLLSCSDAELKQIYSTIDEDILLPKDRSEEIKESYSSSIKYWQDMEQFQESRRVEIHNKIMGAKDISPDEKLNDLSELNDAYNKIEHAKTMSNSLTVDSFIEQLNSKMNHMNAFTFEEVLNFVDMLNRFNVISFDSLAKNALQQGIRKSEDDKFNEIVHSYFVAKNMKGEYYEQ